MGAAPGVHECHRADGCPHGFLGSFWEAPDAFDRAIGRVPMGRVGDVDDVAGLAVLLASPGGSFINGQVIGVDSGLVLNFDRAIAR